ncbi:hypothetical protein PVAG01_05559 [Phlyctema vagabunda]|uniref:Uncharacterized protein n=1 Tax=Phlyctema vagabunda TaxID=108571 RepID=A0ABR4PKE8_9HELO
MSTDPNTRGMAVGKLKRLYNLNETSGYHCARICCVLAYYAGDYVNQANWANQCLDLCYEMRDLETADEGSIAFQAIDDLIDCAHESKRLARLNEPERNQKRAEFWNKFYSHCDVSSSSASSSSLSELGDEEGMDVDGPVVDENSSITGERAAAVEYDETQAQVKDEGEHDNNAVFANYDPLAMQNCTTVGRYDIKPQAQVKDEGQHDHIAALCVCVERAA